MKYGACYVLFNEEDYIEYSLKSIYKFADKIYILFGVPFDGGEFPRDNTKEIVKAFPDPDNKIQLIFTKEKDESTCKNYLKYLCLKDNLDYCWVVDGDEVYAETLMPILFKTMEKVKPEMGEIYCVECWRSLHYYTMFEPRYTFFTTDPSLQIHIRCPSRYVEKNIRFDKNMPFFFHYGLAKTPERIRMKYSTTRVRERKDTPFDLEKWLNEKFIPWRPGCDIKDIYPFQRNIWNDVHRIPDYAIPEIMKTHKWYNKEVIE